jgi:hypothetical protein
MLKKMPVALQKACTKKDKLEKLEIKGMKKEM